jgi:hypothetical protein
MLAELVELVIGVDTHTDTHTAAVVATGTGAVLATCRLSDLGLGGVSGAGRCLLSLIGASGMAR